MCGLAQVRAVDFAERWSVIAPRLGYLDVNQPDGGGARRLYVVAGWLEIQLHPRRRRQRWSRSASPTSFPVRKTPFRTSAMATSTSSSPAATEIFDGGHWLSATGFRIPTDSNWGTQLWYWSNQWDYEVADDWYGLLGVNWFHWMRNAGVDIDAPVTGSI